MLKSSLKYFMLFIIACAASIALYYYVVPEEKRIPIGIEIKK